MFIIIAKEEVQVPMMRQLYDQLCMDPRLKIKKDLKDRYVLELSANNLNKLNKAIEPLVLRIIEVFEEGLGCSTDRMILRLLKKRFASIDFKAHEEGLISFIQSMEGLSKEEATEIYEKIKEVLVEGFRGTGE
jgi:3-methyladenine DNA glycosylase AlkC